MLKNKTFYLGFEYMYVLTSTIQLMDVLTSTIQLRMVKQSLEVSAPLSAKVKKKKNINN